MVDPFSWSTSSSQWADESISEDGDDVQITPLRPRRISFPGACGQVDGRSCECTSPQMVSSDHEDGPSDSGIALMSTLAASPSAFQHPSQVEDMQVSPCSPLHPGELEDMLVSPCSPPENSPTLMRMGVLAGPVMGHVAVSPTATWASRAAPVTLQALTDSLCTGRAADMDASAMDVSPTQMWGPGGIVDQIHAADPSEESSQGSARSFEPGGLVMASCAKMDGTPPSERVESPAALLHLSGLVDLWNRPFSQPRLLGYPDTYFASPGFQLLTAPAECHVARQALSIAADTAAGAESLPPAGASESALLCPPHEQASDDGLASCSHDQKPSPINWQESPHQLAEKFCLQSGRQAKDDAVIAACERLLGPSCRLGKEQAAIVQAIMLRRDVIAILPTGAGKSACFQIPALVTGGTAVVISPLLSLMADQVENLVARGFRAGRLGSDVCRSLRAQVLGDLQRGTIQIVYMSPETMTLAENRFTDLGLALHTAYANGTLSLFAVDEAHCVSAWGAWRKSYQRLGFLRKLFPSAPLLAITATATTTTTQDIQHRLGMHGCLEVRGGSPRRNLCLHVRPAVARARIVAEIAHMAVGGCGLVYVETRARCEAFAAALQSKGVSALSFHAGLSSKERKRRAAQWSQSQCELMVCTSAFSMGVHKDAVNMVLHVGFPRSVTQYVQEIGRGGRNGSACTCISWVSRADKARLTAHPGITEQDQRDIDESWAFFLNVTRCRHALLEGLMGALPEDDGGACSSCDVCRGDVPRHAATIRVKKRPSVGHVAAGSEASRGPRASANPCPQSGCGYALSGLLLGKYGFFRRCTKCRFSRNLSPKGHKSISEQQRKRAAHQQPARFFFAACAATKRRGNSA
jgi:RecQ family ATP-dependent DNA helicase